jgi:hypothetical protein
VLRVAATQEVRVERVRAAIAAGEGGGRQRLAQDVAAEEIAKAQVEALPDEAVALDGRQLEQRQQMGEGVGLGGDQGDPAAGWAMRLFGGMRRRSSCSALRSASVCGFVQTVWIRLEPVTASWWQTRGVPEALVDASATVTGCGAAQAPRASTSGTSRMGRIALPSTMAREA